MADPWIFRSWVEMLPAPVLLSNACPFHVGAEHAGLAAEVAVHEVEVVVVDEVAVVEEEGEAVMAEVERLSKSSL